MRCALWLLHLLLCACRLLSACKMHAEPWAPRHCSNFRRCCRQRHCSYVTSFPTSAAASPALAAATPTSVATAPTLAAATPTLTSGALATVSTSTELVDCSCCCKLVSLVEVSQGDCASPPFVLAVLEGIEGSEVER